MLISAASLMELVNWGLQLAIAQAESMNAPVPFAAAPHDVLTIIMLTYYKLDLGLLSVIVESILIAGAALYFARRVRLAPGALTLLLALGMSVFGATHSNYAGQFLAIFCGSVIAGAIGDVMRLNPGDQKNVRFMLAAFLIPAAYWSVYLSVLALTMGGLWWTPDLIFGSIAYAGLCGLFVNAIAMKEDSGGAEA